jgi:hypothetical protein
MITTIKGGDLSWDQPTGTAISRMAKRKWLTLTPIRTFD